MATGWGEEGKGACGLELTGFQEGELTRSSHACVGEKRRETSNVGSRGNGESMRTREGSGRREQEPLK